MNVCNGGARRLFDAGYMWEEVEKEREGGNMEKIPGLVVLEHLLERTECLLEHTALWKGPLERT